MTSDEFQRHPHRRYNPLTREWVLVSPQRTTRPWRGKESPQKLTQPLPYDPTCYLCPGNERANGARNPNYESTFVFENDYPALLPDSPRYSRNEADLIVASSENGLCLVGCFSPRHDLSIPQMATDQVRKVVDLWSDQYAALSEYPWVRHIQIFENRGALMGASSPHPHCQIWVNATLPDQPAKELHAFDDYYREKKSCLLCDYTKLELREKERLVCQNEHFVALVPYWAVWPFEILLVSTEHRQTFADFSDNENNSLAAILKDITNRYDRVFDVPFPYSMGFHQGTVNEANHLSTQGHFHAHYYPPLLRSATIQKFMVGYELLANPQRDITPEVAAAKLREPTSNR